MAIEGELTVRLVVAPGSIRTVEVRSTRPFAAARVLAGRFPAEAVALAPRLFSICAQAQGAAAAGAVGAAVGALPDPDSSTARERTVRLETIQEYVTRLLIDWPRAAGVAPDPAPVAEARRVIAPWLDPAKAVSSTLATADLADALGTIASRNVYGIAPADWLAALAPASFIAWLDRAATLPARLLRDLVVEAPALGACDVGLFPVLRAEELGASLANELRSEPDFEQAPRLSGTPRETGALARSADHPVLAALIERHGRSAAARMTARLIELARLIATLRDAPADAAVRSTVLDEGEGLGIVETARGVLLHYVRVAGTVVERYRIVAPTEWNFHPQGALVRGLTGAAAANDAEAERIARIAVHALDPCVGFSVEVAHA